MGVKNKSLAERIRYRYIYKGTVEREGKLYKKYEKIARFKNPRRILNIIIVLALVVMLSSLVIYLMRVGGESIFKTH